MGELQAVPWALIAPLLLIQLILMVVALIDLSRIHATNGPKWLWAIIIIIGNLLGSIVYFIIGRKQS
ncbi:phospholipase D-like protein [Ureibacillus xyleni]|uniref:Phospholipase D-like protein n=1 Tax=Ureibacillus xyleni TaxID=614648 RepID=A0A285TKV6_9BACL|nr:PLDc N-terminal domain-containing protein [Ureibacillus xyleni]SOC23151.1 phospholipase D-like protein [Ureibacillus xyleni]